MSVWSIFFNKCFKYPHVIVVWKSLSNSFLKRKSGTGRRVPELIPDHGSQICCLVNRGKMGVNSLPKTVTRKRCGCDLNPGPTAPESSTLTTRLPSHPWYQYIPTEYYRHRSLLGKVTAKTTAVLLSRHGVVLDIAAHKKKSTFISIQGGPKKRGQTHDHNSVKS